MIVNVSARNNECDTSELVDRFTSVGREIVQANVYWSASGSTPSKSICSLESWLLRISWKKARPSLSPTIIVTEFFKLKISVSNCSAKKLQLSETGRLTSMQKSFKKSKPKLQSSETNIVIVCRIYLTTIWLWFNQIQEEIARLKNQSWWWRTRSVTMGIQFIYGSQEMPVVWILAAPNQPLLRNRACKNFRFQIS